MGEKKISVVQKIQHLINRGSRERKQSRRRGGNYPRSNIRKLPDLKDMLPNGRRPHYVFRRQLHTEA